MIDFVYKNWTSQKVPGENFFIKILEKGMMVLKLKGKLELGVNIVGEAKIKSLNKKYRNKNNPTDVLSFPIQNRSHIPYSIFHIQDVGDIFICLSIAKKEAKRENISIGRKLAQLTAHGFLHLNGYDHENSVAEAQKMEKIEDKILDKIKATEFSS